MEEKIAKLMKALEISREEAIELIAEDTRIDKMTSLKEIQDDLTEEQKQAAKKARSTTSADKPKREGRKREEKPDKKFLIEEMIKALEKIGAVEFEIENAERIFAFTFNGTKYKITMSEPRK